MYNKEDIEKVFEKFKDEVGGNPLLVLTHIAKAMDDIYEVPDEDKEYALTYAGIIRYTINDQIIHFEKIQNQDKYRWAKSPKYAAKRAIKDIYNIGDYIKFYKEKYETILELDLDTKIESPKEYMANKNVKSLKLTNNSQE